MVRLEGPIVSELDAVFITDWFSETDELLEGETYQVREASIHQETPAPTSRAPCTGSTRR